MTLDPDTPEWLVLHVDGAGQMHVYGDEEAVVHHKVAQQQGPFHTLAQAKGLASRLGAPWKVNHRLTLVGPEQHAEWLKHNKRTNWAP
jgi:hypothetical protein